LKKKGLRDETIKNNRKLLLYLSRHVDLAKPEEVKGYIATLEKGESYKRNLSLAYWNYTKVFGLSWEKPKYYQSNRLPQIPPEEKVNMIIANSPKKLALALSISRDTGMRPVEVVGLRLCDVDLEHGIIHPNTAKHGSGRVLKVKTTTMNLLSSYLSKQKILKQQDKIFGGWSSARARSRCF
jgi:integrase